MRRKFKPGIGMVSSKEGFTLIEVMLSMFCFLVAMLALSGLSAGTWNGVTVSKTATESSVLGSRFLESLFAENYQDDTITDGVHTFDEDGYTGTYVIGDDAILPNTKSVRLDISYNLKGSTKSVRLYYLVPKVIR